MLDSLTPVFMMMAGTLMLVILPFAIAIGVGLVIVGLVNRRFGAVVMGVGFPLVVFIVATVMQNSAMNHPLAPENIGATAESISTLMPFAIGLAALAFLIGVLPRTIGAIRR